MLKILEKLANSQIKWRYSGYLCCCFTSLVLLSACSSAPHTPAPIRNINIQSNQPEPASASLSSPDSQTNWGYNTGSQQYATVTKPAQSVASSHSAIQSSNLSNYQVKAGDTLYHIATTHGTSYQALAQLNNIAAPYQLLVGEILKVPQQPIAKPKTASTIQNQTSPEDRDYQTIPKGHYTAQKYKVKQGDTLYYIAWISNTSYQELAQLNHIAAPYALQVGEVLQLPQSDTSDSARPTVVTKKVSTKPSNTTANQTSLAQTNQSNLSVSPAKSAIKPVVASAKNSSKNTQNQSQLISQSKKTDGIQWQWPAQGNIIQTFTNSSSDSKGIDISGKKGQPIYAAAKGKVVYAGDALKGYGNLIIIKHNDDYLTAYAHNDTMLVKEGQDVQRGQKIATMGSTGTHQVELHFEIRYKGKAVDPQNYLPQ